MTKTISQEIFPTQDLGCAAALISAGFTLKDLNRSNPKKVLFYFNYKAGIEEATEDYFSDKLQVNARTFWDNCKMIKTRIYSC